ncbi:MAG: hypothetical protein EA422_09895 [Gemmatimonadales bacterium]|nr:MAG: hypothetical protein EA422_09895 [Gemmatimonadales bacterium]
MEGSGRGNGSGDDSIGRDPSGGGVGDLPTLEDRGEPWIETRRGGLFFVNSVLIFPHIMLLVPLLTRIPVRARGGLRGEQVIVDTFPMLAEYLLPRMGWLLVIPIALVLINLREERSLLPRVGLVFFLVLHLAALGWTVATWLGVTGGTLPGGWEG